MTRCARCGKDLAEHEMDVGFQLPDVVWALAEQERAARAKYDSDLCVLDAERYFLRGVLYLPVQGAHGNFGWGLWVEVSQAVFEHYVEIYSRDGRLERDARGVLANTPAAYQDATHCAVAIRFGPATDRPVFVVEPGDHLLYREQHGGITLERLHELVAPYRRE